MWGGELLLNGRIVTSKRACGRPPKTPRPAVVYDEMGWLRSPERAAPSQASREGSPSPAPLPWCSGGSAKPGPPER